VGTAPREETVIIWVSSRVTMTPQRQTLELVNQAVPAALVVISMLALRRYTQPFSNDAKQTKPAGGV